MAYPKTVREMIQRIMETESQPSHGKKEGKFNPIALRKIKIVYNFGLCECNRVDRGTKLFLQDQNKEKKQLLQLCTARTTWSNSVFRSTLV